MKLFIAFTLLTLIGCSSHQPEMSRIFVGQSMADARQITRSRGYSLHDASMLAMEPTPVGFFANIGPKEDLLVLQDEAGEIVSLTIIGNPGRWKSERTFTDIDEYELPKSGG